MYFWLLLSVFIAPAANAAVIRLSPQSVVGRVLSDGLDNLNLEYDARKSLLPLALAKSVYDWRLDAEGSYERSRYETISGTGNLEDRSTLWSVFLNKKLPTGTTLGLNFNRDFERSLLRSTSTRPANQVMDEFDFTFKQELSPNFFGLTDRMQVSIARQGVQVAELLQKHGQQELVLQAIRSFWLAYVSKETLKEKLIARDRYAALVKDLEKKSRQGFLNPGDLPKSRAEYQTQVKNLKEASQAYLANLDSLFILMRITPGDDSVEFEVPEELPKLPKLQMRSADNLRTVQASQIAMDASALARRAARLSGIPELSLFGAASANAVDEKPNRSFSEMSSGQHPRYLMGVHLTYYFDSDRLRGERENAELLYDQALNKYTQTREFEAVKINNAIRNVQATYVMAQSAIESLKQWELAVHEQERSFRQGRIDTSQLILDYNAYASAQSEKTRAIGNYHIALNEMAAAQDELVP